MVWNSYFVHGEKFKIPEKYSKLSISEERVTTRRIVAFCLLLIYRNAQNNLQFKVSEGQTNKKKWIQIFKYIYRRIKCQLFA